MTIGVGKISLKQIEQAVEALPQADKIRLVRRLERQTWGDRLDRLLARIDARVKRRPVSEAQVTALVEQVRQELHAQGGR